ncbi:MAG: PQQ-dependent sugar dehydrogenase [Phycisphaerales bacterium]|nr:PQQ-dependent sugar dehydrogenase [Phycisphaerales bacterium]
MLRQSITACAALLCALAFAPDASAQQVAVRTRLFASGFSFPLHMAQAPGDATRFYVVQKGGLVRIIETSSGTPTILSTPFVNLTGISFAVSSTSDERGLLGMAFHPDYVNNGYVYLYYTAASTNANTLVRMTRSASNPLTLDPASRVTMLSWADPFQNHNGGWLEFGPDGNLYLGTGDGGSANDPDNRSQDITEQRHGKILRVTPTIGNTAPYYSIPADNPFAGAITGDDEIWAFGLRNPWRCAFDRETGALYIADVGQSAQEEISYQPPGVGGRNYGWRCQEGTSCTGLTGCTCNSAALTPPIRTYTRSSTTGGGSITGGRVYRGCAMPDLRGTYFYCDYSSNNYWSFRYNGTTLTEFVQRNAEFRTATGGQTVSVVVSWAEDHEGELYLIAHGGNIYKMIPASGEVVCTPPNPADFNNDGRVNGLDLTQLLSCWGTACGDVDGDGTTGGTDLTALLASWS